MPEFQRKIQKAEAKASMLGNRPKVDAIMTKLATDDLYRKQIFDQLGMDKSAKDSYHRHRTNMLNLSKDRLKDRKKTMKWTIGTGIATGLFSALEGKRRADIGRQQFAREQEIWEELRSDKKKFYDAAWRNLVYPQHLGFAERVHEREMPNYRRGKF
jgi:hypothetical protein